MKVQTPPIKSQGIKTKLIPWINDIILKSGVDIKKANWIEPFFGTGVVGFNSIIKGKYYVGDTNPHIINFYKCVQDGSINSITMRAYLEHEGQNLLRSDNNGYDHYRIIRDRFNKEFNPYDFIFLSRAGFNGMMRFNKNGEWNIPFCKKSNRFSPAYISKICNQVDGIAKIISKGKWNFENVSFKETISKAKSNDIIYCDPPYFGRYADYYNGWNEKDEKMLFSLLSDTSAKFILSTWDHNEFRKNEMMKKYWSKFNVVTKDHFYHNGGNIENRHSIVEALVFNFDLKEISLPIKLQPSLFELELQ